LHETGPSDEYQVKADETVDGCCERRTPQGSFELRIGTFGIIKVSLQLVSRGRPGANRVVVDGWSRSLGPPDQTLEHRVCVDKMLNDVASRPVGTGAAVAPLLVWNLRDGRGHVRREALVAI
jgi:hypothetical protein